MSEKTTADWSNYWRGRAGETAGAALVGAGIENDAELAEFWRGEFADLDVEARVLDLACGAGSALKFAQLAGLTKLAGIDVSSEALEALRKSVPEAVTQICSAADTPFEDGIFDIVVSQFGIEYAGLQASVSEVARLLAPGGQFAAIVHMKDGGIEKEVEGRAAEGRAILDSGFIALAKEVFITARKPRSQENLEAARLAADAIRPAERALAEVAEKYGGLAAHVYTGAQEMYQRLQVYDLPEILEWLDAMQAETEAYVGRMASMINAAATEDDARAALRLMQEHGCATGPVQSFYMNHEPVAWVLKAVKR